MDEAMSLLNVDSAIYDIDFNVQSNVVSNILNDDFMLIADVLNESFESSVDLNNSIGVDDWHNTHANLQRNAISCSADVSLASRILSCSEDYPQNGATSSQSATICNWKQRKERITESKRRYGNDWCVADSSQGITNCRSIPIVQNTVLLAGVAKLESSPKPDGARSAPRVVAKTVRSKRQVLCKTKGPTPKLLDRSMPSPRYLCIVRGPRFKDESIALSRTHRLSDKPQKLSESDESNLSSNMQMDSKSVTRYVLFDSLQDSCSKKVPCPYENCGKLFKNYSALRKHVIFHKPPTHTCSFCGRAFVERSKLRRHALVHTQIKPFQCDYEGCGKRFSLRFNLTTHQRLHLPVKPYVCPICAKDFAQAANLKAHLKMHVKRQRLLGDCHR